jgi:hypothetical protein
MMLMLMSILELDHKTWDKPEDGWKVRDPHIPNRLAGLPAVDLGANARATGEVLAVEQSPLTRSASFP